jgi:YD repeat-containing protein
LYFESHDYSFEQAKELLVREVIPNNESFSVIAPKAGTPPGGRSTDSKTFTIPSNAVRIHVNSLFEFGGPDDGFGATLGNPSAYVTIYDTDGKVVYGPITRTGNKGEQDHVNDIIKLNAGTYRIEATGTARYGGTPNTVNASVSWSLEASQNLVTEIHKGGGVRIAKIIRSYSNGNPDKITKYNYRMTEDSRVKSTGSLLESRYTYEKVMTYREPLDGAVNVDKEVGKFVRFSQNRSSLGSTHGSHVGYGRITVLHGENGENGRSVYQYTSPRNEGNFAYDFPFPPAYNPDYRRGLLLNQSDFAAGSNDTIVSVTNTYSINELDVPAIKVGLLKPGGSSLGSVRLDIYEVMSYKTALGYIRLNKTRERIKQPGTPAMETVTTYEYNETTHKQLTHTSTTNSKGETVVTAFKYPLDYPTSTEAVTKLKNDHIDNTIVEKVMWKKDEENRTYLLSGLFTDFHMNNLVISPRFTYSAKITEPILTTDPFHSVHNLYDSRLEVNAFDSFNNIREVSQPDGMHTSYQWNYVSTLPTAKVDHAHYRQIFYESFEEDITPAISTLEKRTGLKSKFIPGVYTVPGAARPITSGNYVLSYWIKTGNGPWLYVEKSISNYIPGTAVSTNTVNGYLDDVRLYPKGALMTTFTYEPLVGVTSVTDASNVTIYYEYDEFGRLKCQRDQDNSIIECYDYQYGVEVPFPVQN